MLHRCQYMRSIALMAHLYINRSASRKFLIYSINSLGDGCLRPDVTVLWSMEMLHRRMGYFRFDNERCLNCNLLPACFGPCSQKVLETCATDFDKICNYRGLKLSIDEFLTQ